MADGDAAEIKSQLQEFFDELIREKPDGSNPAYQLTDGSGQVDETLLSFARQQWGEDYRDTVRLLQEFQNEELGLMEMPDGTLYPVGEVSPEQRQYAEEYNRRSYNQLLAKYQLDQFSLARQSTLDENDRRMGEYDAKRSSFRDKLDYDDSSLTRALAGIDTWMKGQAIAEGDAARDLEARKEAISYGTSNGKTSFTGRDLGAGVSMLAQQGGMGMDQELIRYPGFQDIDPIGVRMASAAGMGLGSAPPGIPDALTSAGDIPLPPSLSGVPQGGGTMTMPVLETPPGLPTWAPPGAQTPYEPFVMDR